MIIYRYMSKRSKILLIFFIFIILISIGLVYKRSFIDKNFQINTENETTIEPLL
jgi:hypothetical protein